MSPYWQKVETGPYHNIYAKFWNKPLNFEKLKVKVRDDESGKMVDQEFSVLMIDGAILSSTKGKLVVREEYLEAVTAVQSYFDKFPETGAIIVGHPGIGGWFTL